MDKNVNAKRLLRAMSDVDDKYIEEAMETSAPARRAVTTSLRRYSGIIGVVAAAAILLFIGGALMRFMSSSSTQSESADYEPAAHNMEVHSYSDNAVAGEEQSDSYAYVQGQGGAATVAQETTAAAAEVEGGELSLRDSDTYDYMRLVFDSIDDLEGSAQFDINVPESVDGSTSCSYFNYVYENGFNIAEVQYLDDDGNLICVIRKAQGERNISDCVDCFSVERRVEVDDIGTVNLSGNNSGYAVAYWIRGGYSYSVTTDEMITEDAMLELVSQVS